MMVSVELQNMNPKYLSAKVLRHHWGSDFRDWVFITECATWADIEEAGKIDEENFKKNGRIKSGRNIFGCLENISLPIQMKFMRSGRSMESKV